MTESEARAQSICFHDEYDRLIRNSPWGAEDSNFKLLAHKIVLTIGGCRWVTLCDGSNEEEREEQFHTGLHQARLFLAHFYRMKYDSNKGWIVHSADKSEVIRGVGEHPELALDDYRNNVAQYMKIVAAEYESAIKREIWPPQ
jgi:hypothetical protein